MWRKPSGRKTEGATGEYINTLQVSTLTHGDSPSAKRKKVLTEQENSLELMKLPGKSDLFPF